MLDDLEEHEVEYLLNPNGDPFDPAFENLFELGLIDEMGRLTPNGLTTVEYIEEGLIDDYR